MRKRDMRQSVGQMALALNLVIAIFVVGSLGLVSFEISRILLARDQLKHCLELSALAGGATMASTSLTATAAQAEAMTVATNILKMNSVLGQPMTTQVQVVSNPASLAPAAGQVSVAYEWDDPITKQPSANGNVLRVYGAYAYPLLSGGFGAIGVSVYTVVAQVSAGLPSIDLMVVYGNDSGMDDMTPVTLVRRYWDPTVPAISYYIPNPGAPSNGTISGITCPGLFGTGFNALPPQNLEAAGDPRVSNCKREFSEVGPTGNTMPLRGVTNTGAPPGDAPPAQGGIGLPLGPGKATTPGRGSFACEPLLEHHKHSHSWLRELASKLDNFHLEQPAMAWFTSGPDLGSANYNPWGADSTMFTDAVVNIDGNPTFGGCSTMSNVQFGYSSFGYSFSFPDITYLVEAARGNMDNWGVAPNVHVDNNIASSSFTGYQQAYVCAAYQQLQPKISIESSLQKFMTKIQQTADCHFGFVAFNDRAGLSPGDTMTAPTVSAAYPVAGNTTYALPKIGLDPNARNTQAVSNILTPPKTLGAPLFVPNGGSNLADGLQQAYKELTGPNVRPGALKAIVLITDKVPDRDLAGNVYTTPGSNGPALSDALTVASNCRQAGIPIFTMALDQTGGQMTPYFQSQFSDSTAGGLVNTAGNGGVLYINNWNDKVTGATTLTGNFNNVVRQLTSLVKGY